MRTARQALTDITALCDEFSITHPGLTREVRAVLADVELEPAVVWDRDAAREVLLKATYWDLYPDRVLDALEGCVRPAPAQTIDRDALSDVLEVVLPTRAEMAARGTSLEIVVDAVLALLRPVDGGTLTRKEAADVARVLRNTGGRDALAVRLEAAS